MFNYAITSLKDLGATLQDFNASHLITLTDPGAKAPPTPLHLKGKHFILHMHDLDVVNRPGFTGECFVQILGCFIMAV